MLTDKHYEDIMDVLDSFDFDRVHDVMFHLNWKWADSEGVPTVQELRKTARTYLVDVAKEAWKNKSEYITGTGGFRYEAKYYEQDDFLWVRLAFEVDSWDNAE